VTPSSLAAHAAEMRLAMDAAGRIVVAGQTTGSGDLGAGRFSTPRYGIASFVLLVGENGQTQRAAMIGGAEVVALQSIAPAPDGSIVAGGEIDDDRGERQLFFIVLRP
jgi:hypothetical protein